MDRSQIDPDIGVTARADASDVQTDVWVTRITETAVSVTSVKPINLLAETFGFTTNIPKLSDAIEGTPIAAGASIAFDLVFKTGALRPAVESTLANQQKRVAEDATGSLSSDACGVRFTVRVRSSVGMQAD
jgi:hypothetical protein